jgi:hypothetical protein
MLGNGRETQRFPGTHDGFPVKGEGGHFHGNAAGGEEDPLAAGNRNRSVAGNLDPVDAVTLRSGQLPISLQHLDLVLLEQVRDPVGKLFDHVFLARNHFGHVHGRRIDLDAVAGELVTRQGEMLAGIKERLAGNASLVEADTAHRGPLLDNKHLHPQLRCTDRRHITARARAENYQIKDYFAHFHYLSHAVVCI